MIRDIELPFRKSRLCNRRRFHALGSAVTLFLAFAGGEASAGALSVSVAFSPVGGVAPVPLSPWAMGLLGGLVALLAFRGLRRKSPGHGWPLMLLASLGLMLFGATKSWLPEAAADGASSFELAFPSPTISPNLVVESNVSAINATGQTIRVDDVVGPINNSFVYLGTPTSSPKCQKGLVLVPGAICFVAIFVNP